MKRKYVVLCLVLTCSLVALVAVFGFSLFSSRKKITIELVNNSSYVLELCLAQGHEDEGDLKKIEWHRFPRLQNATVTSKDDPITVWLRPVEEEKTRDLIITETPCSRVFVEGRHQWSIQDTDLPQWQKPFGVRIVDSEWLPSEEIGVIVKVFNENVERLECIDAEMDTSSFLPGENGVLIHDSWNSLGKGKKLNFWFAKTHQPEAATMTLLVRREYAKDHISRTFPVGTHEWHLTEADFPKK